MARRSSKKSLRAATTRRSGAAKSNKPDSKKREFFAFLFLTVLLAPAMSVAMVGGYGFSIWIYQLIAGPPSAP